MHNSIVFPSKLTLKESVDLTNKIKQLKKEHLWGVWNIIKKYKDESNDENMSFNVTDLNEKAAYELRRYVNSKYANQKYELKMM